MVVSTHCVTLVGGLCKYFESRHSLNVLVHSGEGGKDQTFKYSSLLIFYDVKE